MRALGIRASGGFGVRRLVAALDFDHARCEKKKAATSRHTPKVATILAVLLSSCGLPALASNEGAVGSLSVADAIARVQPKIVKIYGVGGPAGMEDYQSGFLISAQGHILTAWSYVLDTDTIDVRLSSGRKFSAKLLGADPRLNVAVLKVEAAELPHFDLGQAVEVEAGTRVLAFSNLFGVAAGNEPASVQHGTISVKTRLDARRGTFDTPYHGPVYVLDVVTNNPGEAGGALVTRRGELVGMLGKELRNSLNNTWLNYAMPIGELRESVQQILAGKFVARREEPAKKPARGLSPVSLGILLVPDVVERTPPFVDRVVPGSAAAAAGIRPDDLVVLVGDRLVQSCKALRNELEMIPSGDKVRVTVLRAQEMVQVAIESRDEAGK
jgi:S1-C subfamily serine protease